MDTVRQLSDEALLAAMADGDEAALDAFMSRHQTPLYRFVLHGTGDSHLAADIVQESFVRSWFAAGSYDEERGASGKTWLYSIARNLIRDRLRRKNPLSLLIRKFREDGSNSSDPLETVPDLAPGPSQNAESEDRNAILRRAIIRLPETLRLPLVMCVLEGISQNEAAQILGCSRKAVELRVRRAKDRLKGILG